MIVLVLLVRVAVAGTIYSAFNTRAAREQVDLVVQRPRHDVLQEVEAYFGRTWTRVPGPADVNVRPVLHKDPPTLSVMVRERGPAQCEVSIWVSECTTKFFLMFHAQLARRKKAGLAMTVSPPLSAPPDRRPTAA